MENYNAENGTYKVSRKSKSKGTNAAFYKGNSYGSKTKGNSSRIRKLPSRPVTCSRKKLKTREALVVKTTTESGLVGSDVMEKLKGRTKKSPGEDRRGVENEKGIVRVFPEGVRKEEWLREIKFLFPRADSTKLLKTWEKFAKLHSNPTTRSWSSQELRHVKNFLLETGFRGVHIVELNQMLPDDSKMRDGSEVEEANVLMWSQMGQQLGIDMDGLYKELELLSLDRVKWSRRATKQPSESIAKEIREALGLSSEDNTYDLKGIQVKRARENCCFTDLKESVTNPDEGDVTEIFAKHKHPKNSAIKFTNYSFKASPQLKVFRERYGIVLGPFGYKFRGQFAELNKYYDKNRGIGRHGDVERGPKSLGCSGAVNCLKVGFRIPLLFSWYRDSRPVGKDKALSQLSLVSPFCFPSVKFGRKDWKTNTAAAVLTLGHGDGYMMSAKAIGQDWKSKDFALRHCAGARQYTNLPQSFYQELNEVNEGSEFAKYRSAYSLTFSDKVENDSESPELQFATGYGARIKD